MDSSAVGSRVEKAVQGEADLVDAVEAPGGNRGSGSCHPWRWGRHRRGGVQWGKDDGNVTFKLHDVAVEELPHREKVSLRKERVAGGMSHRGGVEQQNQKCCNNVMMMIGCSVQPLTEELTTKLW